MAVITIFAEAADDSISSTDAAYNTARAGGTLAVTAPIRIGQENNTLGGTFICEEAFISFDTSSLFSPTSVTLSLFGDILIADNAFTVEARLRDWGTSVDTGDWVAGASLGTITPLLATFASTSYVDTAYNDFTNSGTALLDNLNLSGSTRILLNTDRHRLGTTPADIELVHFDSTSGNDPKLVVVAQVTSSDNILNPDVDIFIDSWTTDTGATTNLWQAIDESSPSDTDYVQSPGGAVSTQYYETLLEKAITDPSSSSGHIVHYRYQKNVSGGNIGLTVGLFQGNGNQLTVAQSGLESGMADWAASGNNTSTTTSAQAHSGTQSLETTGTGGGTSRTATPVGTSGRPVQPSAIYTVSAWFRTAATARTCGVDVRWYNSGGGFISLSTGPTVVDNSTGWTQAIGTVTAPATAAFASVEVNAVGTVLSEVHYIDDIILSGPLAQWAHTNISNTWTTQNQALTAAQADSITDYSNLRLRFIPATVTNDRSIAFVADRASANSNAAVTTVDLVLASMTVDNYLIIRTAADNSGGGGAARTITLTNQSGTPINTGTIQQFQQNNDPGAASAGTTVNFLIAKITATSGTVRLTYSGSVVQACVAEEWSGLHATTPVVGTPVGANGVASTNVASVTDASVAFALGVGNLAYGVSSNEGPTADTYTADADTTNGSWVLRTKLGTSNGTADANQTTYAQTKIVTATGAQTWNATRSIARDSASLIVELAVAAPTVRTQVSWANLELPAITAVPRIFGGQAGVSIFPSAILVAFGCGDI